MITIFSTFKSLKESAEEVDNKPKYGCLMLNFSAAFEEKEASGDKGWLESIPEIDPEDIYTDDEDPNPTGYGIEDDPHVTIKYGFHEGVNADEILSTAASVFNNSAVTVELTGLTLFENEKFDVLKYDVVPGILAEANKIVSDKFPNTDTYPDYHPHITVAYLKPGTGKKYVNEEMEHIYITGNELIFSDGDKNKTTINLV